MYMIPLWLAWVLVAVLFVGMFLFGLLWNLVFHGKEIVTAWRQGWKEGRRD
jgi:hypothetical protein